MAPPIEDDGLVSSWEALSSAHAGTDEGWQTIALSSTEHRFRAGVRFPGREQAILVRFEPGKYLEGAELPQGRGFLVSRVSLDAGSDIRVWYCLSRQAGADLDLFIMMVLDVIQSVRQTRPGPEDQLFRKFLQRIRAWQNFMERPRGDVLSDEAEVGLHGELAILEYLVERGLQPARAVEAWQGPLHAVQDFDFGHTMVEVKTTAAVNGFPAKVSSLEQLETPEGVRLFLAGVRICKQTNGLTLPQRVIRVHGLLGDDQEAASGFANRILLAGFVEKAADAYTRPFAVTTIRAFQVLDGFPRLVRSAVAQEIRSADYELDLDLVRLPALDADGFFDSLGVS